VLWCTRQGAGITLDSTRYINAANRPLAMLGVPGWSGGRDVRYPPLLPALLSISQLWGGSPAQFARWLNPLIGAINVLLVGFILLDSGHGRHWIAVWCVATFASASNTLMLHSFVWSEPPYLLWMLSLIVTLRRYCDVEASGRRIFYASLFTSLGMLTRYAGASLLLAGVATILLLGRGSGSLRLRHALLYALISLALPAIWILGNLLTVGSATGRHIGLVSPFSELPQFGKTVLNWCAPEYLPQWVRICIVLWIGLTIAICAIRAIHGRAGSSKPHATSLGPLLVIFSCTYVGFLLVSRALFDDRTPLDWRILSPLFACGIVLISLILQHLWGIARLAMVERPLIAGLCAAVFLGHLVNSSLVARIAAAEGLGWNRVRFQDQQLIQAVKGLLPSTILYSNDAPALAARAERPVLPIPVTSRAQTTASRRLRQFQQDARSGNAYVLYFPKKGRVVDDSLKSLRHIASLRPAVRGSKWTLYQLLPAAVGSSTAPNQR
jgi:hypothetical protein